MPGDNDKAVSCEVDFYVLDGSPDAADRQACALAMMAWEKNLKTFVITAGESASQRLDEFMWRHPEGRFLPHSRAGGEDAGGAPVEIGEISGLKPADVVINLAPEAVPQPERFARVQELVPHAKNEREASRTKFRTYRKLGLDPRTHEISK